MFLGNNWVIKITRWKTLLSSTPNILVLPFPRHLEVLEQQTANFFALQHHLLNLVRSEQNFDNHLQKNTFEFSAQFTKSCAPSGDIVYQRSCIETGLGSLLKQIYIQKALPLLFGRFLLLVYETLLLEQKSTSVELDLRLRHVKFFARSTFGAASPILQSASRNLASSLRAAQSSSAICNIQFTHYLHQFST